MTPSILYWLFVLFASSTSTINAAFLRSGKPLPWRASMKFLRPVRISGVQQFLSHYDRCKDVEMPLFLWGDEIESGILARNAGTGIVDLSIGAGTRVRTLLTDRENEISNQQKLKIPRVLEMFNPAVDMPLCSSKVASMLKPKATQQIVPNGCEWQPEYGSWMVEAVPRAPFNSKHISDLLNVQKSMQLRRKRLHSALEEGELAPTVSNFPMMGVAGYGHTETKDALTGVSTVLKSRSSYVSDSLINPHPRFGTLTKNIRRRRGSKVNILVPVDSAPDVSCPSISQLDGDSDANALSRAESLSTQSSSSDDSDYTKDSSIHMDAMAFGMGCCCLQVTMQAHSENESRFMHDQLAVLAPILHALSAATPIFKGQLAATDTRWNVISQAVDDRTVAERRPDHSTLNLATRRQPALVGEGVRQLTQSRYSEVSLFIARGSTPEEAAALHALNDLPVPIDDEAYRILHTEGGVDTALARHIAHLFVRDPLVIFQDHVDLDDNLSQDHFENIQSTNWRSLRWKPPAVEVGLKNQELKDARSSDHDNTNPTSASTNTMEHSKESKSESESGSESESEPQSQSPDVDVDVDAGSLQSYGPGWRTEFRPLELQLTDFENSAYAILVVLLSRCILAAGHNLYMPMSYVHENMRRAQLKDAVLTQRFWWRKNALTAALSSLSSTAGAFGIPHVSEADLVELTIDEILNGVSGGEEGQKLPGLLSAVTEYIRQNISVEIPTDQQKQQQHQHQHQQSPALASPAVVVASSSAPSGMPSAVEQLHPYVELIRRRASGALPTAARWMRNYVTRHPAYEPGSGRVAPTLASDLLQLCEDVGMGKVQCPELYGQYGPTVVPDLNRVSEQELMYPKF